MENESICLRNLLLNIIYDAKEVISKLEDMSVGEKEPCLINRILNHDGNPVQRLEFGVIELETFLNKVSGKLWSRLSPKEMEETLKHSYTKTMEICELEARIVDLNRQLEVCSAKLVEPK